MAKEKVKYLSGVFASVFAHHGHITKEEAKEISGLEDHEFEDAYDLCAEKAMSYLFFLSDTAKFPKINKIINYNN